MPPVCVSSRGWTQARGSTGEVPPRMEPRHTSSTELDGTRRHRSRTSLLPYFVSSDPRRRAEFSLPRYARVKEEAVTKDGAYLKEGTMEIGMDCMTVSGVAGPLVILDKSKGQVQTTDKVVHIACVYFNDAQRHRPRMLVYFMASMLQGSSVSQLLLLLPMVWTRLVGRTSLF